MTTPMGSVEAATGKAATGKAVKCVAIDTSALLSRYVADARRAFVLDVLSGVGQAGHPVPVVSALARTELLLALHRIAERPETHQELWDGVRRDWDRFWEVPLDARCLNRAAEIGARYGLALADSIHLAAADRLPGSVVYLTLDRQQIPAASDLGFEVSSPADR